MVLSIGADGITLVVNGRAALDPFGEVTIVDSGFSITSAGLVARLDIGLDANFGGDIGLKFNASALLELNTTGANAVLGSTTVTPGFKLRIEGSVSFLGFAKGEGFAEIRIGGGAFVMSFGVAFDLAGLTFSANGVAGIYDDGLVMRVSVSASADAFIFSLSASGLLSLNTTPETREGVERGFKLQLTGSVTLLSLFSFDAGFTIEVGRARPGAAFQEGDWYLNAYASLDFFGFSLSGSIFLSSEGDFSLILSGRMQLGGSFMGIRGSFSLEVSFLKNTDAWGITYYTLFIGGSASVEVYFDFKLFEISLGVGLSLSVSADSRDADINGNVPLKFRITVRFKVLGTWYSRSDTFTIGTVRFPVVPYLASNGRTDYTAAPVGSSGTYRNLRAWESTDTQLYLNVGASPQRTARNVSTGVENETVYIEQIGELSGGLATIKVTAFGFSQTYQHVARVYGYFGSSIDTVTVDPSVKIPVVLDGGAGTDTIVLHGSPATLPGATDSGLCTTYTPADPATFAGSILCGGGDGDTIQVTNAASAVVHGGGGGDTLRHLGTGTVRFYGGDGNDLLVGNAANAKLYGEGDNDTLQGPAALYDGGAGDDLIRATFAIFSSTEATPVVGGTGTDTLQLLLTGDGDDYRVSNPSSGVLLHELGTATKNSSGIEKLVVDAAAGSDQLTLDQVTGNGSGLTSVEVALGSGGTDLVTVIGSSGADTFTLGTHVAAPTGTRTTVALTGGYTAYIAGGVRAQGDRLIVRGRGGNDTIDASAVTVDQLALILDGDDDTDAVTDGNDRIIGSRFDDVLYLGGGNDTATGGLGRDTFFDDGGTNTLVESFEGVDFGLYDNLFVVGLAVGLNFGVGSVAEDLEDIFAIARLTSTGNRATTMLVGDFDGTVVVAGLTLAADPWTGTAYLDAGPGDDLVRVELTRSTGLAVHVLDTSGSDRLVVQGSTAPDDLILDTVASPPTDTGANRIRRVSFSSAGVLTLLGTITHSGVELVEINTLTGGDRIAVRALQVETRIATGEHTDRIAVGSNAAGTGTTDTAWTNTGGTVNDVDAKLTVVGGTGPGPITGSDLLAVDDTGDTAANTGELTFDWITGLGMAVGVTYSGFEFLTIDLGSGGDTFTIHSTHAGNTALTSNNGADAVIVRSVSGVTSVATGAGDDTVRISSTLTGIGGDLVGIDAPLSITGGADTDTLYVDDAATVVDRIGVVTGTTIAGLGMTGGSPKPSLVQVVTVLGATDGRFALAVAGVGTTGQLAFDTSAARMQELLEALVGTGNVLVTKAGGRWTVAWTGALAGPAGWARTLTVVAVPGYALTGSGVTTSVLAMTDGRVDYTLFETLDLTLGSGNDVLNVDGTHAYTTEVHAGPGDDRINVEALSGTTAIEGQAGNDWLLVNPVPGPLGTNLIEGQRLTLDGGANSDTYVVEMFGVGNSRIDVVDVTDGGTNVLGVGGSAGNDTFLLRRGMIAQLSNTAPSGLFQDAEIVTYGPTITGGVVLDGRAGNDTVAFDDTSSVLTVLGGTGDDAFRFGQLYTAYTIATPTPGSVQEHLGFDDFSMPTLETDADFEDVFFDSSRGWLTNGVSYTAYVYGGEGNDRFDVFRNVATLHLFGEAGDDTFIVRSFIAESQVALLNAGTGSDYIEYAANAPVNIDGGDGNDIVIVIGTEAPDTYVITADGVFGAGRVIRYVNVENVSVYGMEGDDVFHVLSTNPAIQLNIYGGLGSDRVEVGGQAPYVQANDLLGHTGLVRHSVESTVGAWNGVPVDGIATEIMDDDEPTVVLAPVGGSLVLVEGATGQLSVRLTFAPTTTVTVTLTGPPANPLSGSRAAALEFWNGSTWETSVTLTFLAGDTAQRLVTVRAAADLAGEGERMHGVDAIVAGGTYERAFVATLFVRVLDDEAPAVNVVVPDGEVSVVEPSAGSVGTMDSVTVQPHPRAGRHGVGARHRTDGPARLHRWHRLVPVADPPVHRHFRADPVRVRRRRHRRRGPAGGPDHGADHLGRRHLRHRHRLRRPAQRDRGLDGAHARRAQGLPDRGHRRLRRRAGPPHLEQLHHHDRDRG